MLKTKTAITYGKNKNINAKLLRKEHFLRKTFGKLSAIVTQNIDGLHQKAGSKNVYEIHGTTQRNYCYKCKMEYHPDYLFNTTQPIPKCECGGLIRPDVTLYGENLPDNSVKMAIKAIENADCLIVGGTSLKVFPAAGFITHFAGEYLIVINKEPLNLSLNDESDLMIVDSLSTVFSKIQDESSRFEKQHKS